MNNTFLDTEILDCKLIKNQIFSDSRGEFSEIYKSINFSDTLHQINYSRSFANVFRGIHQTPYAKIIHCVYGSILDICVDLRPSSKTYLKVVTRKLDSLNMNGLVIPANCGHGFYALTDSVVVYAQENIYTDKTNKNHSYKNFDINIPQLKNAIMSDKDAR